MRLFRLALTATVAALAVAVPAGTAHADEDVCPSRAVGPLEPYACAGTETDGWGGPMYVYAGTCAIEPCAGVTVPVEELVVTVGGVVNDVWQKIAP